MKFVDDVMTNWATVRLFFSPVKIVGGMGEMSVSFRDLGNRGLVEKNHIQKGGKIALHCHWKPLVPLVGLVIGFNHEAGSACPQMHHCTSSFLRLYQISAQSDDSRPSYRDVIIFDLGAVRHLWFAQRWVLTLLLLSQTHNAPVNQISAKSGNAWLSYWCFNKFPPTIFMGPQWAHSQRWVPWVDRTTLNLSST